jgi:outer membrane lipoprotein carrier protein
MRPNPGFLAPGLLAMALVALPLVLWSADTPDVPKLLAGIENRYNHIQTLQVAFTENWTQNGRKRLGSGTLVLRKPGKMRWEYAMPSGVLFISDGEFIYSYYPDQHRAEKIKMKSVEDMRAPLAFLLGRLNFHDDFSAFRSSPQGAQVFLTAIPKSNKMPYTEVSFLTGADFVIHRLIVKEQDSSVLEYSFDGEKTNLPVPDSMFKFTPPPGVEFVDSSKQ